MKKNQKIVFGLILLVSILTMCTVVVKRYSVENNYKNYNMILDYNSIRDLADTSDMTLKEWLVAFQEMGTRYVSVTEETMYSLQKDGKVFAASMEQISEDIDWVVRYPLSFIDAYEAGMVKKMDIVIATRQEKVYKQMVEGLEDRYGVEFFRTYEENGKYVIQLDVAENALESDDIIKGMGLYYDEDKVTEAKEANLEVVLRGFNFNVNTAQLVNVYKQAYEGFDLTPEVYMVAGKEVIGFGDDQAINELAEYINKNNMMITMVEKVDGRQHLIQRGMDKLLAQVGYDRGSRTFTTWDYIQERYAYLNYEGPEEITNTFYRAITERNIRYIFFKPFVNEETGHFITDLEDYQSMFKNLSQRVAAHGIELGKVVGMPELSVGFIKMTLITMGLAVVALILLNALVILPEILNYILLGIGIVGIAGINFVAPNASRILLALCASLGFPALGVLFFIKVLKSFKQGDYSAKILVKSIVLMILSVAFSVLGGYYVAAILGDSTYLLELQIFRGVKISLLMPLAVMCVYYFVELGYNAKGDNMLSAVVYKTRRFMDESIKVKYVILIGIAGVVGYYFLARSGHETNVQPLNLELIMRNFLELKTLARPRNKEFLIAFPSVILCVYCYVKDYKFLTFAFSIATALGLGNVINTFCHIRSPLYLSTARVGYSLVFGIVLGILYLVIFKVAELVWFKVKAYIATN